MTTQLKTPYSVELCRRLAGESARQGLLVSRGRDRYEAGDMLEYDCMGIWPEAPFRGRFRVERFVGGGFAGQVYRCVVEGLQGDVSRVPGISVGARVAVKILVPPEPFARRFRNLLYAVGFQSPFSAQVNAAACRAGLLWQRLAGLTARLTFGRDGVVAEAYASFLDNAMGSYGEVREWVDGRVWRMEPDTKLRLRRARRTARPEDTGSPEYVAKRQFMSRFVLMLHQMGAYELARQYEWWTMKSQPNVLKRTGSDFSPGAGLCAVDFRAGLVLLPFLPMSPADLALIVRGLARGSVAQFDRFDPAMLLRFVEARRLELPGGMQMANRLLAYDREYRRAMPDVFHQGWRLLVSRELRRDVRAGLASAHGMLDRLDGAFVASLADRPVKFAAFALLGVVPWAGRLARKAWGLNRVAKARPDGSLLRGLLPAFRASRDGRCLLRWHRAGRTGEARTRYLLDRPVSFWAQRLTLGLLPAKAHRVLAEPSFAWQAVAEWFRFVRSFLGDASFRATWLRDTVEHGYREGALDETEYRAILAQVDDPFIAKYLKCVGVHFATLPVSEIFWTLSGGAIGLWVFLHGGDWKSAMQGLAAFAVFVPISPGSLVRGGFVLWLMIKERNFRDYMIAGPFSLLKIVGYLAFPLQMFTAYPALSRFMASRWATSAVHAIPVFGEKGALLEHMIFDAFYNRPRMLGAWARGRIRGLLDVWMLIGLLALAGIFALIRPEPVSKLAINSLLAVAVAFILPRVLFYPLLARRKK